MEDKLSGRSEVDPEVELFFARIRSLSANKRLITWLSGKGLVQVTGDLRSLSLDSGSTGSANFSLQRKVATLNSAKCSLSADSLSDSFLSTDSARVTLFKLIDVDAFAFELGRKLLLWFEVLRAAADTEDDEFETELEVPEVEAVEFAAVDKVHRPPKAFSITRFIVSMSSTGGPPIEQFLDGKWLIAIDELEDDDDDDEADDNDTNVETAALVAGVTIVLDPWLVDDRLGAETLATTDVCAFEIPIKIPKKNEIKIRISPIKEKPI